MGYRFSQGVAHGLMSVRTFGAIGSKPSPCRSEPVIGFNAELVFVPIIQMGQSCAEIGARLGSLRSYLSRYMLDIA